MIYSCSLFWTMDEIDLLRLKLEEEKDHVDQFIFAEANTTFRGTSKPMELRHWLSQSKYKDLPISVVHCDTKVITGTNRNDCSLRNAAQRNATTPPDLKDDDIVIWSDLDEIHLRQDLPTMCSVAGALGFIRPRQHMYYYAINLKRSYGWAKAMVFTGDWFKKEGKTIDDLRCSEGGVKVNTEGRHFSWLAKKQDHDLLERKARNHAHPENMKANLRNLESGNGPRGQTLDKVEVDDTYPQGILDDMDRWRHYLA